MSKKNAIEQELDKIESQWEEFIAFNKPILRWLVNPGANQLVSAFIQVQENMDDTVSDLFLPLYCPINKASDFGHALAEEINGRAAASRELVEEATDAPFGWRQMKSNTPTNGYAALELAGESLIRAYGHGFDNLVLVIRPSEIKNASVWSAWWQEIINYIRDAQAWSSRIKLVVFDDEEHSLLNSVAVENEENMASLKPPVDMKSAMTQIFDEVDDGSQGAKYRKHYVALHNAVAENDIAAVERESCLALEIAGKNQWYELWVAVLLTRGSAFINIQRFDDAIKDYQQAQRFAKMGYDEGKAGCDKICLQALLSEGSAWLTQKKLPEATHVYIQCAELAETIGDALFHMDSWRMVSFCQEQQKLKTQAWQSGNKALAAAENLDEDMRSASTLPYVGDALLRISPSSDEAHQVEERMRVYLGDNWRDKVAKPQKETEATC